MQLNVWLLGSEYIEQPSSPLELQRHYLQEFQHISETLGCRQKGMSTLLGEGLCKPSCQNQGPAKVPAGK